MKDWKTMSRALMRSWFLSIMSSIPLAFNDIKIKLESTGYSPLPSPPRLMRQTHPYSVTVWQRDRRMPRDTILSPLAISDGKGDKMEMSRLGLIGVRTGISLNAIMPTQRMLFITHVAKWLVRLPLKTYINLSVCLAGRVHFVMCLANPKDRVST